MGRFFEKEKSEVIGKGYSNRVLLYLESKEDLDILQERWFNGWGEWIEFQSVDVEGEGGGGSLRVRSKVREDREKKLPAFGLVDRDALLNKKMVGESQLNTFFEPEHAVFTDVVKRLLPYIKVLRRWEMENYLLHPVVMKELMEDHANVPSCLSDTAAQCLLDLSETAILLTAANLVLVEHGKKPLSPFFGSKTFVESADGLMEALLAYFKKEGVSSDENAMEENCSKIRAFLRHETDEPEKRWDQLNHLIDGKLFLERFCKWFGFQDPQRLRLARRVRDRDLIDHEILDFMSELKRVALELA